MKSSRSRSPRPRSPPAVAANANANASGTTNARHGHGYGHGHKSSPSPSGAASSSMNARIPPTHASPSASGYNYMHEYGGYGDEYERSSRDMYYERERYGEPRRSSSSSYTRMNERYRDAPPPHPPTYDRTHSTYDDRHNRFAYGHSYDRYSQNYDRIPHESFEYPAHTRDSASRAPYPSSSYYSHPHPPGYYPPSSRHASSQSHHDYYEDQYARYGRYPDRDAHHYDERSYPHPRDYESSERDPYYERASGYPPDHHRSRHDPSDEAYRHHPPKEEKKPIPDERSHSTSSPHDSHSINKSSSHSHSHASSRSHANPPSASSLSSSTEGQTSAGNSSIPAPTFTTAELLKPTPFSSSIRQDILQKLDDTDRQELELSWEQRQLSIARREKEKRLEESYLKLRNAQFEVSMIDRQLRLSQSLREDLENSLITSIAQTSA